jgi:hypothetical protein
MQDYLTIAKKVVNMATTEGNTKSMIAEYKRLRDLVAAIPSTINIGTPVEKKMPDRIKDKLIHWRRIYYFDDFLLCFVVFYILIRIIHSALL